VGVKCGPFCIRCSEGGFGSPPSLDLHLLSTTHKRPNPQQKIMSRITRPAPTEDAIYVQSIAVEAIVGKDAWQKKASQPVIISATVFKNTSPAAQDDDFTKTLDYRNIYKAIRQPAPRADDEVVYPQLVDVVELAGLLAHSIGLKVDKHMSRDGELEIVLPKAILRCEGGVHFKCRWHYDGELDGDHQGNTTIDTDPKAPFLTLKDIKLSCIIGINDDERIKKQHVTMG
jgi:FolB domain-containing protein